MTAEAVDAAGSLDMLLADAALGAGRLLRPDLSTLKFLGALAGRPGPTLGRAKALAGELNRIARGSSSVTPAKRDRRFADPAWTENPLLRRIVQAYLATGRTAQDLVADAELGWRDHERTSFLVSNLVEAAAPSNNPLLSPVAWKAAIDSGGVSALKGLRNLANDLASAPRVPTMVAPDAYRVGVDLALTPGDVVLRTPVFELIRYTPQTETVSATPLLMVPPMINKFYAMDLAPGRSMVEYLVGEGVQVFMVSWRNPDARHADWGFDAYGQAILDATCAITGAERAHLLGTCSGGIVSALAAGHLAAIGSDRLASFTLLVTMLDQERAGTAGAFADPATAKAAIAASRAKGYLDGKTLAEVFAWLRPGDLIWNYWVNNYLLGQKPPAFDLLYWNADSTRMARAAHSWYLRNTYKENNLIHPGRITLKGEKIDLGRIVQPVYAVGAEKDHIVPWDAAWRITQLLGENVRFVLVSSGHIAGIINPPGGKGTYWTTKSNREPVSAEEWRKTATRYDGSWWTDWAAWLAEHSGTKRKLPFHGGDSHPSLQRAPGSYVLEK
jgi:polyhydroxyalkanoate synthase